MRIKISLQICGERPISDPEEKDGEMLEMGLSGSEDAEQTRKARTPPGIWLSTQTTMRPGRNPKLRNRERVAGELAIQTICPD